MKKNMSFFRNKVKILSVQLNKIANVYTPSLSSLFCKSIIQQSVMTKWCTEATKAIHNVPIIVQDSASLRNNLLINNTLFYKIKYCDNINSNFNNRCLSRESKIPLLPVSLPCNLTSTVRHFSGDKRGHHPLKTTLSSLQAKKRVQRKKKKIFKDGAEETKEKKVKGFFSSAPHSFLTFDPDLKSLESPIKKSTPKRDWQVTAYATADEYNLKALLEGLVDQGLYMQASQHKGIVSAHYTEQPLSASLLHSPSVSSSSKKHNLDPDEVLHVVETYHITDEPREIYFFQDGAVIFWNVSEIECESMLRFLTKYESGSYSLDIIEEESESLSYTYSESKTRIVSDTIVMQNDGDIDLEKYTFSNALSMSVKLGIWEESLQRYIDKIEYVVEELSRTGKVVLTQEQVLQKMGQLFALRHMLNLSSDFLDIPDFYWDNPHLEQLFKRTCGILSINKRTSVMNEKINHCVELMELLKSHLGEKHSARLEWIIIILILVEVLFELLHFIK